MTAQMPDQFFYKDQKLDLVGINGSGLSTPLDFKIKTRASSTACWRGYVMRYIITNSELILDGFWFSPIDNELPDINRIKPIKLSRENSEWSSFFTNEYRNLNKKIPFNGSIWVGKDFMYSEYVHMGFQSPTAYKTILKFDFKDGSIVNIEDKSKAVELAREKGSCKESKPKSMNPEDIEDWIMKRFSLNIDLYKKKQNGD